MGLFDEVYRKARRVARAIRDHLIPPPIPEDVIAGRLDGMSSTLSRCKSQLAVLMKEQRELQLKIHRNANQITHHLREARLCTARGEHETAGEHLRARARHEQVSGVLGRQLAEFRGQIERLVDHVRGLEMVVEDARRRKQLLLAQRECIQAHLLLGGAAAGPGAPLGASTMNDLMQDMEQEVISMQVVAQLTAGTGSGLPSPAEVELNEELLRRRVDDELGQLKRQLAQAAPEREREHALPALMDDEVLFITG